MYRFGFDPQTAPCHFCERCLREIYGEGDICRRCLDEQNDEPIYYEED